MKRLFSVVLLILSVNLLIAQIQLDYITPKKNNYTVGEMIEMNIRIKTRPETCLKGMNKVKTYVSGLKIDKLSDWKELTKGIWQAQIILTVIDNKKKTAKLTVMRRVDKEDLFRQEIFSLL